MTKTVNFSLPQWEAHDPLRREDFNTAMADIDAGLGAKPYVVGTYYGTGGDTAVTLGFRPSFLIISGSQSTTQINKDYLGAYDLITAGNTLSDCVTFTDTGFIVHTLANSYYPMLSAGKNYDYIAFR